MNTGYRRYENKLWRVVGGNVGGAVWLRNNDETLSMLIADTEPVTDTELVEENARLTENYEREVRERNELEGKAVQLHEEVERLTLINANLQAEINSWRNTHELDIEYGKYWQDESNDLQAEVCELSAELEELKRKPNPHDVDEFYKE